MRSRLALLLLPLAVLIFVLRPRLPGEVPLHLRLGARGAELRQVDLKFERDEAIARDLTLHFAEGAPATVDRMVRLAPGDYVVAVRLVDRRGQELSDTRPSRVAADGVVELDLTGLR